MSGETVVAPLPLAMLDEHPANPRVATWGLDELVGSIRALGVLTPCIVRPHGDKRFQILAGHRRVRAVAEIGWETIPCTVVTASDSAAWKILLSENLQRRNLNVIEEAHAFQRMRAGGLTILGIAGLLHCTEQRVSRRLALLELEDEYQSKILAGDLSLSEAWTLVAELREDRKHPRKGPRKGEGTGRHSKWNSYFNNNHPLAGVAGTRCDGEGHDVPPRLGPACAACWEEVIRDDQHETTQWEIFGDEDKQLIEARQASSQASEGVTP